MTFVFVFAVYYIAINFIHLVTAMYKVQLLLICASGALLYYIRFKYRLVYSILEVITGIFLTIKGIDSVQESFSIAFWLSVSGGQYIIVRGISNFMEGRQVLIPYWRKIWGQNSE